MLFSKYRVKTCKKSTSIIASQEFEKKSAISTIPLLFLFRHKLYFGLKFENVLAFAALQSD